MKINSKISNGVKMPKTKTIATIIATFAVFFVTFFALAENKNANNLFLDSDQDGLTDQEEKMIGTDPYNPDTDGDGYSDGKELASGYNPLKPAPGDQLLPAQKNASSQATTAPASAQTSQNSANANANESLSATDISSNPLTSNPLNGLNNNLLDAQAISDLSSDPNNPNLTNEMVGSFLQLTLDKSQNQTDSTATPSYSDTDINQIVQNALSSSGISQNLPEIRDDEIKLLPQIDDKKLTADEIKAKQKEEIQKYLASLAFIFATNAPFPVDTPENFTPSLKKEQESLLSAMTGGDQAKIDEYAQRARAGIEQIKKVEVPYILQDVHKSALQLAIYTLDFKDKVAIDPNDPMKNLAALSSLQAVAESTMKLQGELTNILNEYGIDFVEMK